MIRAFVAQSILHALIAGLVIEALLWAWRVDDAPWRLRLRLVALAEPILVLPILVLLPWRGTAAFAGSWALFASERWNQLRVAGAGAGDLVLVCAAGVGAALFLRDALPPLLDALPGASAIHRSSAIAAPTPASVRALAAAHAAALGAPAPEVRVLRSRLPVLLCEHARRPVLVVSVATLEQLDEASLDAAIAHEIAHAAHRDPMWGYALIAARALTFFNPATQWTARAVVDEIERRADQVALRLTRRPEALARAIRLLSLASPPTSDVADRFERLFWQSRIAGVHRRCERVVRAAQPAALAHGWLRVALAAGGLVALLFFVV